MKILIAVAMGGALGAVSRYYVAGQVMRLLGASFPFGTLTVNVVGCFVMGMMVEIMALVWSPSPELRAFITVGFLGALTTFSSFSLDAILLHERGESLAALAYVAASVLLSLGAFFIAMKLFRYLLT